MLDQSGLKCNDCLLQGEQHSTEQIKLNVSDCLPTPKEQRQRERKEKRDEVQESEINISRLGKKVSTQSSRMLYFQLHCGYPVHVTDTVTVVLHGFTVE